MMAEKKKDNIDFQGLEKTKTLDKSYKVKWLLIAVVIAILLVVAIILVIAILPTKKVSKSLVEVNLEEGDTLMYRVDQRFEVKGKDLEKETISSIVGFQVVNKTSDAYWFLLKINTSSKDKEDSVKSAITGYFRVRLLSSKGYSNGTGNETTSFFELHGKPQTDEEFVRYLHGLLYQLLPEARRDLYEEVDGQTDKNVKPENSPLFPGPVRMHRQANTKQGDDVMVKNHFSQSDLVNSSSDMDMDVKYTDSAAINKSNGMVSESNVFMSEQLNFGEPIRTKDGRDVTTMRITLYSHVTRIEVHSTFFEQAEMKGLKTDSFVRLMVPTKESRGSSNDTLGDQRLSTREPTTANIRNRRAVGLASNQTTTPYPGGGGGNTTVGSIAPTQISNTSLQNPRLYLRKILDLSLSIEKSFSLFDKRILGIRTKGEGNAWLKSKTVGNETKKLEFEMGTDLLVTVGGSKITVYREKYSNEELEKGIGRELSLSWDSGEIPFCFRALIVRFCVDFRFGVSFTIKPPKLLTQETSLSPPKLALQVESFAEVTTNVRAYATVLVVRAGVFADGTILRVTIPTKLSYSAVKPSNQQWCLASDAQLIAVELHAGLFYQWKKCRWLFFSCRWGTRHTILSFGRWAALRKNFKLYEVCF